MADFSSGSVTGGSGGSAVGSKGRRFAAGWVDLVLIPIFLGVVVGLLLLKTPEGIRNVILILLNIGWMIFRDMIFSPGRKFELRRIINMIALVLSGIGVLLAVVKLVPPVAIVFVGLVGGISLIVLLLDKTGTGANLKLVSLTGEKVTIGQAFIRNILLIIPFVLVFGYIIEVVALLVKGERVADGWAKTRVVEV